MPDVETRKKGKRIALKPTQLLLRTDIADLTSVTVYQRTAEGFPWKDVKAMMRATGLDTNENFVSKITGKSVKTIKRLGYHVPKRLSPQRSAVAYQYAKVLEHATEVFGSQELAERWMFEPCRFLNGNVPFDMIEISIGFQTVEDYLTRMDHGIYQ
ncbi:antitoxin Xre/MbcA/ParS toxin-binding domain-containing protein [Pseudomonas oryzihabitans]|uniref:Antitoxin Xre/MbcA/ParS-like toxin-binding domain-containing protein n=1 Tax=Pseudomonas oryzihabitans TaxID=47885 RepID=A0A2Z5ACM3_9PSED|nr:antitoxin Xre/MbcA/ParS toxin-binding domain-containing protein [Pseudomonas oryzihabitans]AXA67736.1 hypothetical protein CE139_18565 [Pseudomonas oryzihabitans]